MSADEQITPGQSVPAPPRIGCRSTLDPGWRGYALPRRVGKRFARALTFLMSVSVFASVLRADAPTTMPTFTDDLAHGLAAWSIELEKGGIVDAKDGALTIDVPAGCTVWLRHELDGPVAIDYDAVAISAGGANDRVSDLNCFWMARDARSPGDVFATQRSGAFADYNELRGYYVGLGGNTNTTTRFRRYIGSPTTRPLLPEHDLRSPLLVANRPQHVRLVADGRRIEYWHDGAKVFALDDAEPYASGWFGFRTTASHLEIRTFRVTRP